MKYSIGLDLGTSSVKAVLFDGTEVIKKASAPFELKTCALSDGAEYIGFSADDYAKTVFGVIAELAKHVNGNICGIAMASASGNALLCDDNGNAMINAYSWTTPAFPQESQQIYGHIERKDGAYVSGWGYSCILPLAHLAHVKVHSPEILDNAKTICMSTEYLLYKMTGKWGIDRSTAVPFYLLEQETGKWHTPYLKALNIKEEQLPKVYESGELLGEITQEFANKYGINSDCKVYLGSFDHPSGAIANNVVNVGDLLLSCGTSWVLFFPYSDRKFLIENGFLCDTFLSKQKGVWGAMSSIAKISGNIDKIIEKNISSVDKVRYFNEYASLANRGADGLRINPITDVDKDFSEYSKENIARALMEGAAYLLKERLDSLKQLGIEFTSVKMAGGPSQSKLWVEIISYIIDKPIEVIYGVDSGAVGAAKRCF